nr:MAG TPA: hypothetical protein [Crassvirales sp.]DAQ45713.1 MAG TPA: hypothetical protein [Caudoviricetes sp.]DAR45899.1 MAG TPA: hypothetical protein [Bacteriophage sp.]DAW89359.1 MAG TPA: hypothetical protein [Caudoviricetes sp.]
MPRLQLSCHLCYFTHEEELPITGAATGSSRTNIVEHTGIEPVSKRRFNRPNSQ